MAEKKYISVNPIGNESNEQVKFTNKDNEFHGTLMSKNPNTNETKDVRDIFVGDVRVDGKNITPTAEGGRRVVDLTQNVELFPIEIDPREPAFSEWEVVPKFDAYGHELKMVLRNDGRWEVKFDDGTEDWKTVTQPKGSPTSINLQWYDDEIDKVATGLDEIVAERTDENLLGYRLGPEGGLNEDRIVAPAGRAHDEPLFVSWKNGKNVAAGRRAVVESSESGALAFGYEAVAVGDNAVELGTGTNDTPNSLAYKGHIVVEEDGDGNCKIPNERLVIDDAPINGSERPVSSGGVYSEVERIDSTISILGEHVEEEVARIDSTISNLREYTESRFDQVDSTISNLSEHVDDEVERLDGEISELRDYTEDRFDQVDSAMSALREHVDEEDEATREEMREGFQQVAGQISDIGEHLEIIDGQIDDIDSSLSEVWSMIPDQAGEDNQLADKNFVNSSIQTNTASFKGTYNNHENLGLPNTATHEQIAEKLQEAIDAKHLTYDDNDYAFVEIPHDDSEPTVFERIERYKCVKTSEEGVEPATFEWEYEWTLNNSSFTVEQWAAINSGITSGKIDDINTHMGNTNNPHQVTAEQIGALKLVKDRNNNKTAVTIGQRNGAFPVGPDSIAQGWNVSTINGLTMARGNGSAAVGDYSYAEGKESKSLGQFSHAEGRKTVAKGNYAKSSGSETSAAGEASEASGYRAVTAQSGSGESTSSPHKSAFAWQGQKGDAEREHYHSHGDGTFNINPVPKDGDDDPASGFYIGETSLKDRLESAVEDYVKMEDLVDGLQVDEISANGITIDGKKPSLEGHTHQISDVDGLEDEMNELNGRHFVKINNDDTVDAVAYNSVEHTRQFAHQTEASWARPVVGFRIDFGKYIKAAFATTGQISKVKFNYIGIHTNNYSGQGYIQITEVGGSQVLAKSNTITITNHQNTQDVFTFNNAPFLDADKPYEVRIYKSDGTVPTEIGIRFSNQIHDVEFGTFQTSTSSAEMRPNYVFRGSVDATYVENSPCIPLVTKPELQRCASDDVPAMDSGDGSAGSSNTFSRGDHVHPSDASKRGLTDLVVYEDGIANDYWQTGSTQMPLASESGMSKTYSNGETTNCYKVIVDDYRSIGGTFRVSAYQYVMGSWGIVVSPQSSQQEITHVEQTSGGSLVFDYKGEHMPVPTLDTLAKKTDTTLTPIYSDTPTFSEWVCNPATIDGYGVVVVDKSDTIPPQWALEVLTIGEVETLPYVEDATTLVFADNGITATRVRTDIIGYTLGSQDDKPVAAAEPLLFSQYYPDGSVKSAAEFRDDIKYNLNDSNHTATVKTFCNTGIATNDNSNLEGRVVIPPFVDGDGNPYISDDGTRYKVVGVGSGTDSNNSNENLTAVIAPSTVANIEDKAFHRCTKLTSVSAQAATSIGSGAFNTCSSLVSVSLPAAASIVSWTFVNCTSLKSISLSAATSIGDNAFRNCTSLKSVSLPAATSIKGNAFNSCYLLVSVSLPVAVNIKGSAFNGCYSLASVSLPAATSIEDYAFVGCTSLESIDFGATLSSVPTLGSNVFNNVPTTCKIIVPYTQYDAWIAAENWRDLHQEFVRHAEKADKPATFTEGNLAEFDANGNPTDSGKKPSDFQPLLTFDNAPTQGSSNPVTSAGIKAAIDGIKPTRIYNSAGTDALDDKGGLHKSDIVQSSWTLKKSGTATTYTFSYAGRNAGNNPNLFWWAQDGQNYSWMTYNPTTGVIDYVAGGTRTHTNLGTTEYGLDPSTGDVLPDISGITIKMFPNQATISGDLTFTPTQVQLLSESYTHLAVESVPTRTIAASTVYAVGDLLGDDGKAYRCIQEYTSDATPVAPSLDMTRWVEIPVLSQKADKPATYTPGNLASLDSQGNPTDSQIPVEDVVTKEELEEGVTTDEIVADGITIDGKECATKDLVGQEFNFATTQGFMNAIAACVRAFGGTVINNPSEQSQGGN